MVHVLKVDVVKWLRRANITMQCSGYGAYHEYEFRNEVLSFLAGEDAESEAVRLLLSAFAIDLNPEEELAWLSPLLLVPPRFIFSRILLVLAR